MRPATTISRSSIVIAVFFVIGVGVCGFLWRSSHNSVVGTWVVDVDRQARSMLEAAERDLGPSPAEFAASFRQRAEEMHCEYCFEKDHTVTIRFDTNDDSYGMETGTWERTGTRIVASVSKVAGPQAGMTFDRIMRVDGGSLRMTIPQNNVTWYLRRK